MQHLQPNTTLQGGKYRIERVLGQGGFGNTYLARNTVFDVDVAIKEFFMKDENNRDGSSVTMPNTTKQELFHGQKEKFKKEAKRMFAINNEHIISVHDLFEENGTAYYVMDYVDGENLAERLKRTSKPMTEAEVNQILPQILDALKTVHDAGIWHLDLKPTNIMVDKTGKVKLIDFGASKQFNTQKGGATTSTAISYTNGYAPREQMEQNLNKIGPWTDIYALGATLYALLSKKKPPLPSDIDDDMSADKHLALPMPPNVSEDMKQFVLWLMQTNRQKRPQTISAVSDRFYNSVQKHTGRAFYGNTPKDDESDEGKGEGTILIGINDEDNDILSRYDSYIYEDIFKDHHDLLVSADKGDAQSQFLLGDWFFEHSGKEEYKKETPRWYEKAVQQGHLEAMYKLALCYECGRGVDKNDSEAITWYSKAAKGGHAKSVNKLFFLLDGEAMFQFGKCYENGIGVAKNYKDAMEWYKKAAKKGFSPARIKVLHSYLYGYMVSKDIKEALKWDEKTGEGLGRTDLCTIGNAYDKGEGIPENKSKAIEYYRKAANLDNAEAQYKLGEYYEKGIEVAVDKKRAVEWYEKAAAQGNSLAMDSVNRLKHSNKGLSCLGGVLCFLIPMFATYFFLENVIAQDWLNPGVTILGYLIKRDGVISVVSFLVGILCIDLADKSLRGNGI